MERAYDTRPKYGGGRLTGLSPEEYRILHPKTKVKWRFKPKNIGPFLCWGFAVFLFIKIVLWPLTEGICNYISKSNELSQLKVKYNTLDNQLSSMRKNRQYMETPAYVEERGHQIGMIKANEAQLMVIEPTNETGYKAVPKKRKPVEIGD